MKDFRFEQLSMSSITQDFVTALRPFIKHVIDLFNFLGFAFEELVNWSYLYHFLVLLLFLFAILLSIRYHKKWKEGWLSTYIDQKMENTNLARTTTASEINTNNYLSFTAIRNFFSLLKLYYIELFDAGLSYLKQKARNDFKQRYFPSFTSFILFFILFLFLFVLTHTDVPYERLFNFEFWKQLQTKTATSDSNQFSNTLAVVAGLVAIIFALVIFVAESIRDNGDYELKRVLLKESKLWFLVTFTIFSLLNFLWLKINALSIVFPVIIGLIAILAFSRVILNLISPEVFQKSKSKFLRERMHRIVGDSVRERIGNNILLGKVGIDKEIKAEYIFSKRWMDSKSKDYLFIETQQEGFISDIHLQEFSNLIEYLEHEANKLGFSICNEKFLGLTSGEVTAVPQGKEVTKKAPVRKVYLLKRFGEYLPENSIFNKDNKIILAIPNEFDNNPDIISHIRNLIPHIFRFSTEETSSDIFRKELKTTKDQLIKAIKELSLGEMDELKNLYLQFAESFLEVLHKFGGGGYTAEQARKERSSLFAGWNELRWLNEDIRELLLVASDSGNKDVISGIAFLPVAIATRAIQAKDHLLFQEFIRFTPFLYGLAQKQEDNDLKSYMIDRSWRYTKELSDFYIEPELEDREEKHTVEELKEYRDFALHTFLIFQSLLKAAFENGDIESFRTIIKEFTQLYRHFEPKNYYNSADYLRLELEQAIGDRKNEIAEQLKLQETRENIANEINISRQQVLFSLGAWIFEKYRIGSGSDLKLAEFYTEIQQYLPNKIQDLTSVFLSTRSFDVEDFWGWGNWEMVADGEAHIIDFQSKLDRLYCVKALQLLQSMPDTEIAAIKLPHNRSLAFLVVNNGGLIKILDDMVTNPNSWSFIISPAIAARIEALKTLLKDAKKTQETEEEEKIKNIELSPNKIDEFISTFQKQFYQNATLRNLINNFGNLEDLSSTIELKPEVKMWGFNQIDDKAAFIENWHVHYPGWGEQFGRGLADSENEEVFETISNSLSEITISGKEDVINVIEKLLQEKPVKDTIVIGTFNFDLKYSGLLKSVKYVNRWNQTAEKLGYEDVESYLGYIKLENLNVPVFGIFLRKPDLKNIVCVLSLKCIGVWRQYPPIEKTEDKQYQRDIFMIRIRDLNKESQFRADIIAKNPEWLQNHEDKDGYLRQKVVINIYEKFNFEISKKTTGYKLIIENKKVNPRDGK